MENREKQIISEMERRKDLLKELIKNKYIESPLDKDEPSVEYYNDCNGQTYNHTGGLIEILKNHGFDHIHASFIYRRRTNTYGPCGFDCWETLYIVPEAILNPDFDMVEYTKDDVYNNTSMHNNRTVQYPILNHPKK